MDLGGSRLGNFSLSTRRLVVGVALIPCVLFVASHYLNWGLAGRFGKEAIAGSFVVLFLVMRYLGPTVDDLRRLRNAERHDDHL